MKSYKLFITIVAILLSIETFAYDALVDGIYYNLNTSQNTASVTYKEYDVSTYSGDIVIPSNVRVHGIDFSVTSIYGDSKEKVGAFMNCKELKSVVLPSSIISIGSYAFWGCLSLNRINIPNSVKKIYPYAFADCSNLKEIAVPSWDCVGQYSFINCDLNLFIVYGYGNRLSSNRYTNAGNIAYSKIKFIKDDITIKGESHEYYGSSNYAKGVKFKIEEESFHKLRKIRIDKVDHFLANNAGVVVTDIVAEIAPSEKDTKGYYFVKNLDKKTAYSISAFFDYYGEEYVASKVFYTDNDTPVYDTKNEPDLKDGGTSTNRSQTTLTFYIEKFKQWDDESLDSREFGIKINDEEYKIDSKPLVIKNLVPKTNYKFVPYIIYGTNKVYGYESSRTTLGTFRVLKSRPIPLQPALVLKVILKAMLMCQTHFYQLMATLFMMRIIS